MQDRKNFTYVKKASGKERNKLVWAVVFPVAVFFEIDQQMYKNYMDFQSRNNSSVYLKDDVEHHANKKFN